MINFLSLIVEVGEENVDDFERSGIVVRKYLFSTSTVMVLRRSRAYRELTWKDIAVSSFSREAFPPILLVHCKKILELSVKRSVILMASCRLFNLSCKHQMLGNH